MKKVIFTSLGALTFMIGTIGIFVPLIPTTPLYLATAFFWLRSSEKLYQRFTASKNYQRYIQPFVTKELSTKSLLKMFGGMFFVFALSFLVVDHLFVRLLLIGIYLALLVGLTSYLKGPQLIKKIRPKE